DDRKEGFHTVTMELEHAADTRIFSVFANDCADLAKLQRNISQWRAPSLALLRGTVLGQADFARYHSFGGWRLTPTGQPVMLNGAPVIDPPRPGLHIEDEYDAVLYLGPPSEMHYSDGGHCPN